MKLTRRDHAERVFLADVAFESQHADVSVLIDEALVVANSPGIEETLLDTGVQVAAIVGAEISWSIVAGHHQSKRVTAQLSRRLHGDVGIDDGARVYGSDWRLKNVDAFEKEWPLLGEEDRETLVRRDDQLICFDLREIGIDRQVDCDRRARDEFRRQSGLESDRARKS